MCYRVGVSQADTGLVLFSLCPRGLCLCDTVCTLSTKRKEDRGLGGRLLSTGPRSRVHSGGTPGWVQGLLSVFSLPLPAESRRSYCLVIAPDSSPLRETHSGGHPECFHVLFAGTFWNTASYFGHNFHSVPHTSKICSGLLKRLRGLVFLFLACTLL